MGRVKAEVKSLREAMIRSGQYFCNKCQQVKSLDHFSKGSEKAKHMFGIVPQCKECSYGYVKQWASENRDRMVRATIAHRQREISKDAEAYRKRARELDHARFLANPEKRRETNRRSNKRCALRRTLAESARKSRVKGSLTASQSRQVIDFYGNKCLCCGTGSKISIDHIVPLSKGGAHEIWNIQPLCVACNSSKGARRSTDYRPDNGVQFQEVSHVQ